MRQPLGNVPPDYLVGAILWAATGILTKHGHRDDETIARRLETVFGGALGDVIVTYQPDYIRISVPADVMCRRCGNALRKSVSVGVGSNIGHADACLVPLIEAAQDKPLRYVYEIRNDSSYKDIP